MRDWRTTAAASVSAAAAFVLFAQSQHYIDFPGWAMALAGFANIGGLQALGIAAKDASK